MLIPAQRALLTAALRLCALPAVSVACDGARRAAPPPPSLVLEHWSVRIALAPRAGSRPTCILCHPALSGPPATAHRRVRQIVRCACAGGILLQRDHMAGELLQTADESPVAHPTSAHGRSGDLPSCTAWRTIAERPAGTVPTKRSRSGRRGAREGTTKRSAEISGPR